MNKNFLCEISYKNSPFTALNKINNKNKKAPKNLGAFLL
jgi:hypothetical protein